MSTIKSASTIVDIQQTTNNAKLKIACSASVFWAGESLVMFVLFVAAITFARPKKTPALQATLKMSCNGSLYR